MCYDSLVLAMRLHESPECQRPFVCRFRQVPAPREPTACLLIAVLGIAFVLLTFGSTSARAAAGPSLSVESGRVVLSAVPHELRALGEVESLGRTTLAAPMTGKIVGPFQTEGEVAAGAVIARNVPANLQSSIASARADVAMAKAAFARTRQLVAQRLRTGIALDQARRAFAQARDKLDGLREEAAQQVIRAPFAGTLRYLVSPGTVTYKGTPIATLSGRGTPWIDIHVPPDAARCLHAGERARIAATGWSGTGRVASVGHDARPLGLVQVRIGLPDGNPLVPGEWAWVRLTRPGRPAPTVAESAVVMRDGRSIVFVLQRGLAHAVPVRVLAEWNGRAWIAGPLHAGQRVAVTHATRLVEDSRITAHSDPFPGVAR